MVREYLGTIKPSRHSADADRPQRPAGETTNGHSRSAKSNHENRQDSSLSGVLKREVLSQTPSLEGLVEALTVAASHEVTVLLNGETGTGKTHLAHLIHSHSSRKDQPLL